MKKLKIKVFFTLLASLSIVVVLLTFLYNYMEYKEARGDVGHTLDELKKGAMSADLYSGRGPMIFSDIPVALAIIGKDDEIGYYTNFGPQAQAHLDEWVEEILESSKRSGLDDLNLYFQDYAWARTGQSSLIILELTKVKKDLWQDLTDSLAAAAGAEAVLIFLSWIITRWIVKPVEEAFARQKTFIADSSHELKTPLAVIVASAEAASQDPDPKWIRNIELEAGRMSRLITRLLDLTRTETAKPEQLIRMNLSKAVELALLPYESVAFEKGISIDYSIQPNLMIKGETDQIKQIVAILLDNALSHTKPQGRITLDLKRAKNQAVLSVANEGDPIAEKDLPHIFERFYRSDEARNRSENRYGLGLAIAKNIAETHQGTIQAINQPEEVLFTVRFPIHE